MIIHVCGASGSGKTYIGEKFYNKMNVIDTDDWTEEYSNLDIKTKKSYINFINNKINNLDKNKMNLLVGYLDFYINNELVIYPISTDYKFFIKISAKKLFIQYNVRLINWICKNKKNAISKIKDYKLLPFKELEEIKKDYKKDLDEYVNKLNYIPLTQNEIIKFLIKK